MWLKFQGSDAVRLTKVLREIYSNVEMKILVIVSQSETKEMAQVIEAGADGYFVPPFVVDKFCQRLHRCMLLDDITRLCGPALNSTKASFCMFEVGNYALGKTLGLSAVEKNPSCSVSELFLAINMNTTDRELASSHYNTVTLRSAELSEVLEFFRNEANAVFSKGEIDALKAVSSGFIKTAVKLPGGADQQLAASKAADAEKFAQPPEKKRRQVVDGLVAPLISVGAADIKLGSGELRAPDPEPKVIPMSASEPPRMPIPEGAAPKQEIVKRKRVKIAKEMLGSFASVEDLQKEVFGKVEKAQPLLGIPRYMLDQGVSEIDLIQPLGLESVFSRPNDTAVLEFGTVVSFENTVVPWLPTQAIE